MRDGPDEFSSTAIRDCDTAGALNGSTWRGRRLDNASSDRDGERAGLISGWVVFCPTGPGFTAHLKFSINIRSTLSRSFVTKKARPSGETLMRAALKS